MTPQPKIQLSELLECTECGAVGTGTFTHKAGCSCPGTYESASTRAKAGIAANPGMSDYFIADAIGVHRSTVGRARESTGANAPVEKRVGKDGRRRRRRPYYESWPKAEQARRLQEATGVLSRSPS